MKSPTHHPPTHLHCSLAGPNASVEYQAGASWTCSRSNAMVSAPHPLTVDAMSQDMASPTATLGGDPPLGVHLPAHIATSMM